MKALEKEWIKYRDACYPEGLPKFQETETRQAFYAGCLVVLKTAVEGIQSKSEEQAYQHLIAVINEAETVCSERIYEMKGRN